jgi:hypothetical protein
MVARRRALLEVGGFDERIGPGSGGIEAGEDADLIARLLRRGCVLASGTGTPVRHADWRTDTESAEVLEAYERGAGVWIGASLRARDRMAVHLLRARLAMVRRRGREVGAARLAAQLGRGLVAGLRLRPWTPDDGQAPRSS